MPAIDQQGDSKSRRIPRRTLSTGARKAAKREEAPYLSRGFDWRGVGEFAGPRAVLEVMTRGGDSPFKHILVFQSDLFLGSSSVSSLSGWIKSKFGSIVENAESHFHVAGRCDGI